MIICPLILLILAFLLRAWAGSWLHPSAFMSAYWCLALTFPLLFAQDFPYSFEALAFIVLGVASFTLGGITGSITPISRRSKQPNTGFSTTRIRLVCIVGSLAGLLASWVTASGAGVNLSAVLSLSGLFATGNNLAVIRYETSSLPYEQLAAALLAVAYAACICAPFLAAHAAHNSLYRTAPFLGLLSYSVVSTARLPILIAGALLLSGAMAKKVHDTRGPAKLRTSAILKGVAALLVIAILFSVIAFIRVGGISQDIRPVITAKLQVYAMGYLSGYSQWFDQSSEDASPSTALGLGAGTIAGLGAVTGGDRNDARAYGDFESLNAGSVTNIYTIFRGLVTDFGRSGAILFLFFMGIAMSRCYEWSKNLQRLRSTLTLAIGYGVMALSNTMSITSFTNVCIGILLAYFVLCFRHTPASFDESKSRLPTIAVRGNPTRSGMLYSQRDL